MQDDANAEITLLGALLMRPENIRRVRSIVTVDDFSGSIHADVYEAMLSLTDEGKDAADVVLISARCEYPDEAKVLVNDAFCSVPNSNNFQQYAELVAENSMRRRMLMLAKEIEEMLENGAAPSYVAQSVVRTIEDTQKRSAPGAVSIRDIMKQSSDGVTDPDISTGWMSLDKIHGGGIDSESFTIIAGAPSIGKTQFALNLLLKASKNGKPVRSLYICQEMSGVEIQDRIIAHLGGVPSQACKVIRSGRAKPHTMERFGTQYNKGQEKAAVLPMIIYARGCITINQFEGLVARYCKDVDIVVLDYIQQVMASHRKQTEFEKVSEISGKCKALASLYRVPVVGLSQFSRDGYRDGGKPQMAHLRQSGQIEQDANNIWLLWREREPKAHEEDLEVNVAKQRNGPTAVTTLRFLLDTGRIENQTAFWERSQDAYEHEESW